VALPLGHNHLFYQSLGVAADVFHVDLLDTANRLTEAIGMYKSFGFKICKPHRIYPKELMPHLVFMELPLARGNVKRVKR